MTQAQIARWREAFLAISDPEHCLTAFTVEGLRGIAKAALQEVDPKFDYSSVFGPPAESATEEAHRLGYEWGWRAAKAHYVCLPSGQGFLKQG